MRRETAENEIIDIDLTNISIHSLRAEGDVAHPELFPVQYNISIHSLRAEGDQRKNYEYAVAHPISIHSLRAEGDSNLLQHL